MTRVKKLTLTALTALALTAGVIAAPPAAKLAGDPSQWGLESLAKKGSFDITEVSDDQVAKKGSFDITEQQLASNDDKNGDVPVVPGLARKVNEYEGQHIADAGDPSQWG